MARAYHPGSAGLLIGLSGLSLGAMPGINSWDVLVYAPLVVVLGLLLWRRSRADDGPAARQALLYSIVVPVIGLGLYLPYLLAIQPGSVHGVLPVLSPSEPVSFLLTWGFFFAVIAVAIARQTAAAAVPAPDRRPVHLPRLLLGCDRGGPARRTCWSAGRAASRT